MEIKKRYGMSHEDSFVFMECQVCGKQQSKHQMFLSDDERELHCCGCNNAEVYELPNWMDEE